MSERNTHRDGRACDLLAAYETDLLDPDQRLAFENHLDDCPDCLEDIFAMAPASVAMAEDPGRLARASRSALTPASPSIREQLGSFFQPRFLLPSAIAAALALVLVVPAMRDGSSLQDLARIEPLPYARLDMRSGAEEPARLFQEGMDFYVAGEYTQASDRLEQAASLQEGWPTDAVSLPAGMMDQTRIYLGVSYLLSDLPTMAVAPLVAASGSPLPPLADRARWYLTQAYLLDDQAQPALDILDTLQKSPVYGERARDLIATISAR